MPTMQVTISDEVLKELDERARRSGDDRAHVAARLIEKGLHEVTIDDVLEPFRAGFRTSGLTEVALGDLMDSELEAVRAKRRSKLASR